MGICLSTEIGEWIFDRNRRIKNIFNPFQTTKLDTQSFWTNKHGEFNLMRHLATWTSQGCIYFVLGWSQRTYLSFLSIPEPVPPLPPPWCWPRPTIGNSAFVFGAIVFKKRNVPIRAQTRLQSHMGHATGCSRKRLCFWTCIKTCINLFEKNTVFQTKTNKCILMAA